jgi:hypothetical protein
MRRAYSIPASAVRSSSEWNSVPATSSGLGFDTLLLALSNQNVFADRVSADLDLAKLVALANDRSLQIILDVPISSVHATSPAARIWASLRAAWERAIQEPSEPPPRGHPPHRPAFFHPKVFATVSPGEPYLHNWHIETIAYQLERVFLGETTRLLINQPPRSLKSICVSVAYVAWLLGRDPTRRVIAVSYSGDFAAELHRQFRQVASSEWYAALFPHTRWAKETGLEFVTILGGGRYATSVGGTLTGRGADLIVIDDPLNAAEAQSEAARKRVIDWFGGSLVSRLNDKRTGSCGAR